MTRTAKKFIYCALVIVSMALLNLPRKADAALSFVACGTAVAVGSGNMASVGIPSGIASDDILIAYVHQRDNIDSTMPGDWTNTVSGNGNTTNRLEIFWKRTTGSESAPTVTHAAGDSSIARICAFRGADTSGDPFNVTGSVQSNAGSPISTTAITTTVAGAMILHIFGSQDNNTWGTYTGTPTNEAGQNANGTGTDDSSALTYGLLASAGSTGAAGASQASLGPDAGASVQVALRPFIAVTTLGDGTDPSNSSIAPGASATDLDTFTLQTNSGSDTVTAATATLASGTSGGLSVVAVTSNDGLTTYCSSSNPASDSVSLSSCAIPVSTTLTSFKIRITPKSHAAMPSPPGSTYAVTGTITSFTGTNSQSGTDTDSATVTIDNASPANVTSASGSAGDTQVSLSWTNPADSDFHSTIVLRRAGTATSDTPEEGTTYIVGNTIVSSAVACVVATPTASCTDTGLTNGTAYHYRIYARDTNANYSQTGVVPTGSPLTPSPAADTTAPAAVANLATGSVTSSSLVVSWTAPGDDNNTGTATTYDLRYSTATITDGNFSSATQVTGEPAPSIAGSSESKTVSSLSANTTYFFALKTSDEVPNTSALSNVASGTTSAAADTTAPAAISNLAASNAANNSIDLSWTAPGDDNNSGTATTYDLRYSTATITDGNFSSATQVSGEPTPQVAGANQSMSVTGLSASTLYYFAIKTSDEVPNTSAISNVVSLSTTAAPDTTAPAAITNLSLSNPSESSIAVSWTAPGDDNNTGTATTYDLRYSTATITDGNFSSATQVTGEPTPSIAGSSESKTISGLSANTTYFFALKTSDEVPNVSALSNVPSTSTSAPAETGGTTGGVQPRRVLFSGRAYPESVIEVSRRSSLEELYAQTPAETSRAQSDGTFSISFTGIIGADYLFALRATDKENRQSGTLTFDVSLFGDLFEAKDILMPPTVGLEKSSVTKNDILEVRGFAAPDFAVELEVDGAKYRETKANREGLWEIGIDTVYLGLGEHRLRARHIAPDGKKSNFSPTRVFRLSRLQTSRADINGDGNITISDWSIFLFRWGSEKEELKSLNDLNGDGAVNIFDFSIFLQAMKI